MNRNLAIYYVENLAGIKSFNLQSIAIQRFVKKVNKRDFKEDLNKTLSEFNNIYPPFITRDIIFKGNSLVTRNNKLVSPAHYFLYTKLVFDLVINRHSKNSVISYKTPCITAYYSGNLFTNLNDIDTPRKIIFDYSYNNFQKQLINFEGKQAFVLDLENFFDSIKTENLLNVLYNKYDNADVKKLEELFHTLNINTLPQFHHSIASSILSQEYLAEFDREITKILLNKNIKMVRFVDDMYFFIMGPTLEERYFHTILDQINKVLWKYGLNINANKIKLYIEEEYKFELAKGYNELYIKTDKRIDDKSSAIAVNGEFLSFIREVNYLYQNKGFNIREFSSMFEKTFSINQEDGKKVLNNFVFSKKWMQLEDDDMKYIVQNYDFIFFMPDIFFTFYLMIYDYYERQFGRDDETIRKVLRKIDKYSKSSLRYLYSSIHYLIQRNFRRKRFLKRINKFDNNLGYFIKQYII